MSQVITPRMLEGATDLRCLGVNQFAWKHVLAMELIGALRAHKVVILGVDVIGIDEDGTPTATTDDNWCFSPRDIDEDVEKSYQRALEYIDTHHRKKGEGFCYSFVCDGDRAYWSGDWDVSRLLIPSLAERRRIIAAWLADREQALRDKNITIEVLIDTQECLRVSFAFEKRVCLGEVIVHDPGYVPYYHVCFEVAGWDAARGAAKLVNFWYDEEETRVSEIAENLDKTINAAWEYDRLRC